MRAILPILSALFKLLGVIALALIGIVAGVLVALQSDWAREGVKTTVVAILNSSIAGRIEVDRLGGTLPFSIELEGVRIFDPEGHRVLSVQSLATSLAVFELLERRVDVSSLAVTEPSVVLFDAEGRIGLARAFAPRVPSPPTPEDTTPGEPWEIRVRSIALSTARIDGVLPGQDVDLFNLALSLAVTVDETGVHWRDLQLNSNVLTSPDLAWVADGGGISIVSDGTLGSDRVTVKRFELQVGPQALSLSGDVDLTGKTDGDLTISGLKLDTRGAAILPAQLRGAFASDGVITLTPSSVAVSLGLISDLGSLALQVGADLNTASIFGASAGLELGAWGLHLQAAGLQLADFIPVSLSLPASLSPAATLGFGVDFEGYGLPTDAAHQLQGTIDLQGLSTGSEPGRALITVAHLQAAGLLDPGWGIAIELGQLDMQPWLGYAGFSGLQGLVDRSQMRGLVTLTETEHGLVPSIAFAGGIRAEARGTIPVDGADEPVEVKQLRSLFEVQWDGESLPELAVFVSAEGLRGFGVQAEVLKARVFGATPGEGGLTLAGTLEGKGLYYDDIAVGALAMPLEGRVTLSSAGAVALTWAKLEPDIESLSIGGELGWRRLTGLLRVDERAGGHRLHGRLALARLAAGPATIAETELDLDLALPRVDGPDLMGTTRASGTVAMIVSGVALATGPGEVMRVTDGSIGANLVWPDGLLGALDVSGRMSFTELVGSGVKVATSEISYGAHISPGQREIAKLVTDAQVMAELSEISFTDTALLARRPVQKATIRARTAEGGRVPVELSVELDARYAFKTLAEVHLPTPRRAFSGTVDAFQLLDRQTARAIVTLDGAILSPEGIVSISGLNVLGPLDANGRIAVGGYLDLKQSEIDANIDVIDLDVAAFIAMADEILGTPLLPGPRLGGILKADIDVYGELKAPTLALTLQLEQGAFNEGKGITADVKIDAVPAGVTSDITATWRDGGGKLSLTADLPGQWSLDPIGIVWDDGRRVAIDVALDEPDLVAAAEALRTLLGVELPYTIAGSLNAELKVGGRPGAATTDFTLNTKNLVFDGFDDADLSISIGTASPDTHADIMVMRRDGALLGRIRAALPFTLARAMRQLDPAAYLKGRLLAEPLSLSVDMPLTVLGTTPLRLFLPADLQVISVGSELRFEGSLSQPSFSGFVDLAGLEILPEGSVTRLELVTVVDALQLSATTTGFDGRLWIDADVTVPQLSHVLLQPEKALDILSDPAFQVSVFTADLPTFDFWRILPEVGDPASQFMPDGSLMVTVNARGGPEGPTGNAVARLRTHAKASGRDAKLDPRTRAGLRNVANDIFITATMTPTETTARVLMLQEPKAPAATGEAPSEGHEHLGMELTLDLGTGPLLAGAPLNFEALKVKGSVDAVDFRLAGLAATMRSVLGSTDGELGGRIDVAGTVGRPIFSGGLTLNFADLAIAPIGFRREDVELKLAFDDRNRVTLEGLEFEEPAETGDKPAHMGIKLAATIEALDAAKIKIEGGVSWWRFPVVARKDATVRISGDIALVGTVAKPKISGALEIDKAELAPALASRSVRAIGLPAGVSFVRGDPKPPTEVAAIKEFSTGAEVDIAIRIPPGTTFLEPALFLAVGEVRAALELNTGDQALYIRTSQGRLGIYGTIFVPKENVQVYGKKFVMDEDSRIVFTGDMETDPQLRITARYNISHIDLSSIGLRSARDSTVGIKILGNVTDPRITFISDPSMDEGNMLSIIALGTPSGGGDALATQARGQLVSAFLSMATLELGRGLTESLPIEVLKLDTLTGDNDLRLTVGKRITDDLYIYYRSEWGGTRRTNTVWAEYRLGRILYVSAEYGDNANPERPAETSVRASVRITP